MDPESRLARWNAKKPWGNVEQLLAKLTAIQSAADAHQDGVVNDDPEPALDGAPEDRRFVKEEDKGVVLEM